MNKYFHPQAKQVGKVEGGDVDYSLAGNISELVITKVG